MQQFVSLCIVLCCLCTVLATANDTLYTKAFGNAKHPAVVFLHGGPGYNSTSFELSAAQKLAQLGIYVLVYDQRGCGNSEKYSGEGAHKGSFSFDAQCADILIVMDKYGVQKATLIGHSWGGTLGTQFALRYPHRVTSLILVGSPMSYQMSFRNIISRCSVIATLRNDSNTILATQRLRTADTTALYYATECFMLAMRNGLYTAKLPSHESKQFYAEQKENPAVMKAMQKMTMPPTFGAYAAEKYTMLNMYTDWEKLSKNIPMFAIYGAEDGLFDAEQKQLITTVVGKGRYYELSQCGHNVFIDQATEFIRLVTQIVGK